MIEADWIRLYRAVPAGAVYTGYESWWTSSAEHARSYADELAPGDGQVVTALVELGLVLDLRFDIAANLAELGIDHHDYQGASVFELAADLAQFFAAMGYRWVVVNPSLDPSRDEWLYLADGSIPVTAH